jgi:hypothetical protein
LAYATPVVGARLVGYFDDKGGAFAKVPLENYLVTQAQTSGSAPVGHRPNGGQATDTAVDRSMGMTERAERMIRRAAKTCYFLNRRARYLALIARGVRLPATLGVWIPIADADRAPWEMTELLDATYPHLDAHSLSFVALLTDFEVDQFEGELPQQLNPRRAR